MAELLKYLYNPKLISSLCSSLKSLYESFDSDGFTEDIFCDEWDEKELKHRMRHISENLGKYLPDDYAKSLKILKLLAPHFSGFEYMFFPDFVELHGLDDFELSVSALEYFTEFSSSEFAVRPFIKKYPIKMMAQMEMWAESDNHHVRRLASEGCRPRLPWANALPLFKKNPQAVLRVIEKLKNDDSEYVRRSVANNLNDISKDNPQIVILISQQWIGINKDTDWIVKHACRTLLRQGNPQVLHLFGFSKPINITINNLEIQKSVAIGDKLVFSFSIKSSVGKLGKLRIEYAIDFMKKNGKLSRKIFKISEADYLEQEKSISRHQSFKIISTRKYYCGNHMLAIIVNGQELAIGKFLVNN
jgi:3-methyladenine DNA glycosylase AlkC